MFNFKWEKSETLLLQLAKKCIFLILLVKTMWEKACTSGNISHSITLSCGKSRKHHRRGTECVWMNWTALRWFPADVTGLVCWPTISEQLVSRAESCSPSNQSTLQHGWVKNVWETDPIHSRRATGSWSLLDCDNWEDASIVIHILVCHEAQLAG